MRMKMKMKMFHSDKISDEFFLKFWGLSGAKECKSCRSRKILKNAPTLAIVAVHTAENEPLKIWGWFHSCFNELPTGHSAGLPVQICSAEEQEGRRMKANSTYRFSAYFSGLLLKLIQKSNLEAMVYSWEISQIFLRDKPSTESFPKWLNCWRKLAYSFQ